MTSQILLLWTWLSNHRERGVVGISVPTAFQSPLPRRYVSQGNGTVHLRSPFKVGDGEVSRCMSLEHTLPKCPWWDIFGRELGGWQPQLVRHLTALFYLVAVMSDNGSTPEFPTRLPLWRSPEANRQHDPVCSCRKASLAKCPQGLLGFRRQSTGWTQDARSHREKASGRARGEG